MKYHIIGINKVGINTYNFLKKKKQIVTISDIKNDKYKKKDFYYNGHPKKLINQSNKLIYCPGVIRSEDEYNKYLLKNKAISELEIFYKFKNWPKKNILFVTGSRGKSSVCNLILKKLRKLKLFEKIFYLDRNRYTFSNLPIYKNGYFLVAEVDYQTLLVGKCLKAKYRIFTSYFKKENKAFKSDYLYFKAKLKIFNNLDKNSIIIINKKTLKKIKIKPNKFKNRFLLVKNKRSTQDNNSILCDTILNQIKKNEKYKLFK